MAIFPASSPHSSTTALLVLILLTLLGARAGAEYHARFGKTCAGQVAVRIEPKSLQFGGCWGPPKVLQNAKNIDHGKLIVSPRAISECIERYPALKYSPSLAETSSEQIFAEISNNITVKQDREDPYLYELTYQSHSMSEGSEILHRLVSSYRISADAQAKEEAEAEVAAFETDSELKPTEMAAFKELHKAIQGYRFMIVISPHNTYIAPQQMFWSIFIGAVIFFLFSAALFIFVKTVQTYRKAIPAG